MNIEARDWLDHLRNVRHLSEATISAYAQDLAAWSSFLTERGLTMDMADQNQACSFMTLMSMKRLAPSTVNRRLSALKGYYQWRRRRDASLDNPFRRTGTVKQGRRLPCYLTYEEIEEFLDSIGDDFAGKRDRALLELLYSTGCRIGEICAMNVGDVLRRQVKVRGKGSRDRIVFIGSKAAEALEDYCTLRLEHAADNPDSRRALLLNLRGRRLTARGARYLIRKYSALIGMAKVVHPHTFRHSFATHVHDEGANIRTVQELLGHSSLSTTQIYTHTGIERIKRIYRKSHPHGKKAVNSEA